MDGLQAFWETLPPDVRETLLRLLLAALALVVVVLLRSLLARLLVAPLRRLTLRTPVPWDTVLLDALVMPVRVLLIAFGLWLAARILGVSPATTIFIDHLSRSLVAIALFLAGFRAVQLFTPSSSRVFQLTGLTVEERLLPFIRTGAKLVLALWLLVVLMQEWGFDPSGLLASGGLLALGLGLAAQDTVANVFGFTAIVGDQPFVIGDFIKTPDVEGVVEQVGLRATRVRRLDQALVTVPNSKLASSAILNWSRLSKRWLDVRLLLPYHTSSQQLSALLERLRAQLAARETVEKDSVVVYFINFGDSGLEVLVRCYLLFADWVAFTAEKESILLEIMQMVESAGLTFAFPSRSVYIETMPTPPDGAAARIHPSTEERSA